MTAAQISDFVVRRDDIHAAYLSSGKESQPIHHPRHEYTQCQHVRRVQLFSGLDESEMKQIAAAARSLRKERGEFVYMSGDRADSVYVLEKGRIKLSVLSETGKEIAIDIIQPGEMFVAGFLTPGTSLPASYHSSSAIEIVAGDGPSRKVGGR